MIVEHVYTCNWEYYIIIEKESIPLVAQPCKKYLSWEDDVVYRPQGVNHMNSDRYAYSHTTMAELKRDVLFEDRLWLVPGCS